MKTPRALAFAFGLGLTVLAGPAQEIVEEIVAIVNDDIITMSEFRREYDIRVEAAKAQVQGADLEKTLESIKAGLLDELITDALLLQMAKEKNINVADQVKMYIEDVKKKNNIDSDDDLKRALGSQGYEWDPWIKQIEEMMLRQGLLATEINRLIVLDDAEVVDYFRKHANEFVVPAEYHLRAVYLALTGRTPAELEAHKAAVAAKAKAGEDFAALAEGSGDPPLKDVKGDLGTLKAAELDPVLVKAVQGLKTGEISGWTETKNGWYLLKVEERKDSRPLAFEEAKKQIEQKLWVEKQNVKLGEFLETIKKRSFIKILKPNPFADK